MNIAIPNPLATLRALCSFTAAALVGLLNCAAQTALDSGEVNAAYSFQFTIDPAPENGTEYSATGLPPGLSINSTTGLISGVPTTDGLFDEGIITLTYPNLESDNLAISITIAAALGTPEITSSATKSGTVGEALSYTVTASNSPQSFNLSGDLPDGVSFLSESISGTPTEAGTFNITLSGNNTSGTGADFALTLTIDPAGAVPTITSAAFLSGDANALLSYQITATESPTSYTASGLPPGLTIDTGSGFISGTPTIDGVYNVDLTASNANGTSDVFQLTVIIGDIPQISSSLTISGIEDDPITEYQLSASNSPTSFTVSTESLPAGLSYSSTTKKITGTPTEAGTFNVEAYASNAVGDGTPSTIVITIEAQPDLPVLRSASFNVEHQTDGSIKLYLVFEQSVEDLTNYDWLIETSTDLDAWTQIDIDDASLEVTITDNQDGSKSVSVLYPDFDPSDPQVYFRYRVQSKTAG